MEVTWLGGHLWFHFRGHDLEKLVYKCRFRQMDFVAEIQTPGNSLWPFWDGEFTWPFCNWWIVTSNDRGWKGHGGWITWRRFFPLLDFTSWKKWIMRPKSPRKTMEVLQFLNRNLFRWVIQGAVFFNICFFKAKLLFLDHSIPFHLHPPKQTRTLGNYWGPSFPGSMLNFGGVCFFVEIHPRRLTWNLQITHLERKMIFQTSREWCSMLIFRGVGSLKTCVC